MTRLSYVIIFLFISIFTNTIDAQTVYRDKIAVIVNTTTIRDNSMGSEEIDLESAGATYLMIVKFLELNKSFQVVSRDETDFSVEAVRKIFERDNIKNSSWNEYTEKMKEKSKGIGANWLILVNRLVHWQGSLQKTYYQFKFLQVQTNRMIVHTVRLQNVIDTNKMSLDEIKKVAEAQAIEILTEFGKEVDKIWGIILSPTKIKGKTISAIANLPTTVDLGDEVLWFQWVQHVIGGETFYEILNHGSSKLNKQNSDGTIDFISKSNLSSFDPKTLCGKFNNELELSNSSKYSVSFLEFSESDISNKYLRFELNSSIYQSIKENREFYLIQLGEKDYIYSEKNLQKREDFLFGSSVKQSNAFKSNCLILVKDLGSSNQKFHIEINFTDKESSTILKSSIINCEPDDFAKNLNLFFNSLYMHECRVNKIDDKNLELWSTTDMENEEGQIMKLYDWREMELDGEIVKIRIPIAEIQFKDKRGQRYLFNKVNVLDSSFNKIDSSRILYVGF